MSRLWLLLPRHVCGRPIWGYLTGTRCDWERHSAGEVMHVLVLLITTDYLLYVHYMYTFLHLQTSEVVNETVSLERAVATFELDLDISGELYYYLLLLITTATYYYLLLLLTIT